MHFNILAVQTKLSFTNSTRKVMSLPYAMFSKFITEFELNEPTLKAPM